MAVPDLMVAAVEDRVAAWSWALGRKRAERYTSPSCLPSYSCEKA